ncbi:MAG: PfkB family carbohydrate kinase [Anaerolineae bacterium]|nr:permease [Chloroflexota bacterium]
MNTQSAGARYDVLGYGAIALDDLLYLEHFPVPDTKMPIQHVVRQGGGLTATALVAVARLGGRAGYAGVLGSDSLSREAMEGLQQEGVDCEHVLRQEGAGPVRAVVIIDSSAGTRTILYEASHLTIRPSEAISDALLQSARVLFLDGRIAASGRQVAARARALGMPVVADVERLTDAGVEEMMEHTDHLIVGQALAAQVTGHSDPERACEALWREDRVAAIVTAGGCGSWYRTAGQPVRHQPIYPVEVVDTTGCGDVYHGAYALQLARGASVEQCVRYAAAVAALKATKPGGRTGIPSHAVVLQFLRERDGA